MERFIYLDNAATTKVNPKVLEAMLPYFTEKFGNASPIYSIAAESKKAITEGREQIADVLGADPSEIYFTAGGSESDNWALKATAEAYESKGKHIITTKIEHHAILHTCEYLEKRGFEVTYLNVDENGIVDMNELKAAIRPDTILISVMFANNEIGTIPVSYTHLAAPGGMGRRHGPQDRSRRSYAGRTAPYGEAGLSAADGAAGHLQAFDPPISGNGAFGGGPAADEGQTGRSHQAGGDRLKDFSAFRRGLLMVY